MSMSGLVTLAVDLARFRMDLGKAYGMFSSTVGKMNRMPVGRAPGFGGGVFAGGMLGGMLRSAGIISAGAGFAGAIKMFGTFEEKMVDIRANARLLGDEGEAAFGRIEKAVRGAAQTSRFNPGEVAGAMNELILGGLNAKDAMDALNGTLDTSIATGMSLENTAKAIVDSIAVFNDVTAKTAGTVGDYLVSSQTMAQHKAEDLTAALTSAGSMAGTMNISMKESVAMLTAFAKGGQRGAKAGTAFRRVLARLANPSKQGQEVMDRLGIDKKKYFDSKNNITDFVGLMTELAVKLEDSGDAFTMFGDRASAILAPLKVIRDTMREGGKSFLTDAIKQLEDDAGRAAEIAAEKTKTFIGRVLELVSALQELSISTLKPLTENVNSFVMSITEGVRALSRFNESTKGLLSTLVGVSGGLVALAGALRLLSYFKAIALANPFTVIATSIAAVIAGIMHMTQITDPKLFAEWKAAWEGIRENFQRGFSSIVENWDEIKKALGADSWAGSIVENVQNAVSATLDELEIWTSDWENAFKAIEDMANLAAISIEDSFKLYLGKTKNYIVAFARTVGNILSPTGADGEQNSTMKSIWGAIGEGWGKMIRDALNAKTGGKAPNTLFEKFLDMWAETLEEDGRRLTAESMAARARGDYTPWDMLQIENQAVDNDPAHIARQKAMNDKAEELQAKREQNKAKRDELRKERESKKAFDLLFDTVTGEVDRAIEKQKRQRKERLGADIEAEAEAVQKGIELKNRGGFFGIKEYGRMIQEGILNSEKKKAEEDQAKNVKNVADNTKNMQQQMADWNSKGLKVRGDLAAVLGDPGGFA